MSTRTIDNVLRCSLDAIEQARDAIIDSYVSENQARDLIEALTHLRGAWTDLDWLSGTLPARIGNMPTMDNGAVLPEEVLATAPPPPTTPLGVDLPAAHPPASERGKRRGNARPGVISRRERNAAGGSS